MNKRRKLWQYRAGERGHRVTVYEAELGGVIQARVWNPERRCYLRRSLRTRDRDFAGRWALGEAARLKEGRASLTDRLSVGRLLAKYLRHRTPRKSATEQQHDARRAEMWARLLGGSREAADITLRDWERFVDARGAGAIDGRGHPVPERKRRRLRERTVEADCIWLKLVFRWATQWHENGRYLLSESPVRGFHPPTVKNVRRPVAAADRYERVRAVAGQVKMSVFENGKRESRPSYLVELLDLIHVSGHRLSSVLNLRHADYLPRYKTESGKILTHGALRWRGEYDKQGRESITPLEVVAQKAI